MANSDYGTRFSEEKYATRGEVSKELRMAVVDSIWAAIQKYRANFIRYLPLKNIEKSPFFYCGCTYFNNLINESEAKLLSLYSKYSPLENEDKEELKKDMYAKCIKHLANSLHLEISDAYLYELINGYKRSISNNNDEILEHYLNALKTVNEKRYNAIDIDFLAEIYSKITGNDELTSFYRDKQEENRSSLGHVYLQAPINLIEGMMNALFEFLSSSKNGPLTNALITYFYVRYIKPFPKYNEEIAILLAKAVIAHSQIGEVSTYIPLEGFFYENKEMLYKVFIETQKTNDLNYFLIHCFNESLLKIQDVLDQIALNIGKIMKKDFYQSDEIKSDSPTSQIKDEDKKLVQSSLLDFPLDNKEEIKESEIKKADFHSVDTSKKEEKSSIVKDNNENKEKEIKANNSLNISKEAEQTLSINKIEEKPKKEYKKADFINNDSSLKGRIAVSFIPPSIDEKEANRLEIHLLECDPYLKKGEAKFYARHCTLGKMYTIAQFKKYNNCAYETARVGMESLVKLGYYKKEQIKNKFVYTPIVRK